MDFSISNLTLDHSHPQFLKSETAVKNVMNSYAKLNEALLFQLSQSEVIVQKLSTFKNGYSTFVVVGIGGSSLGAQVLQDYFALENFIFIDNVDALVFEHQLTSLKDLKKTLWLFISKSGETIETLAGIELIQQFYSEKGLDLAAQSIVITENKTSSLFNWAQKNQTLHFDVPLVVGGRYSVLSHVGLVPAVLMNLNLASIESGARLALKHQKQISEFVAEILQSYERKEYITVLWSYSSRLKKFGFWWQQLWSESLSKRISIHGKPARQASTPLPLVGATDQHSVLQQIAEGAKDKFVIFLRSGASEAGKMIIRKPIFDNCIDLKSKTLGHLLSAEADATQISLDKLKVSNLTLKVEQQNEETLGFLFMFFQISVLALGDLLEINPIDQPGVEQSKKLCNQLLADRKNV